MRYAYLLIILALVVACSPTQENMDGMEEMHVTSEEEFVVEMIPHHQEAVDTSLIVMNNTDNPELKNLTERIIKAQRKEIDMMKGWLDTYYDGRHNASYEEMMPPLREMEGDAQDVAYLEGMIQHHQMAVMMAEQVLKLDPSPHVREFANGVIEVQTTEINEMQEMLEDYDTE